MSRDEFHVGKLTDMNMPTGLTKIEQWEWLKDKGINFDWCYPEDDYFYTEEVIIVKDKAFRVQSYESSSYQTVINPETLEFTCGFYNGGTNLRECLEEEMEKMLND